MKISGDRATSIVGLIGSMLVVQQVWAPDLLRPEAAGTIGALLVALGGGAANKECVHVPFTERKPKLSPQADLEIQALRAELDELRGIPRQGYPERRDLDG